jgi:hypothetical protein
MVFYYQLSERFARALVIPSIMIVFGVLQNSKKVFLDLCVGAIIMFILMYKFLP